MMRKFIFDVMDSDIINIEEQTIIKDTGVSTERIKDKVMSIVRSRKQTKRFNKKILFSLIAAVITVTLLSNGVCAAMGGFNQLFGDWYAGSPAYGLFSGDNISYTSQIVDIDFKGIAGDDDFVGASMKIKNKDGSSFVNGADNIVLYGSNDIEVTQPVWNKIFHNNPNRGGSVWYSMDDENTISVTAFYGDENGGIKGERMTIKEESLTAYRLDEFICYPSDENAETIIKEYESKLGENQVIFQYSSDGTYENNKYYVATETEIPLDFEISVTLNYKNTTRNLDNSKGKNFEINGRKWEINSIAAKSFSMDVSLSTSSWEFPDYPDFDNLDEIEAAKSTHEYLEKLDSLEVTIEFEITMRDGTKLKAVGNTAEIEKNSEGNCSGTVNLYYMQNGSYAALDPNEIVSVNGFGKKIFG